MERLLLCFYVDADAGPEFHCEVVIIHGNLVDQPSDEDAEIAPVPAGKVGHIVEPEMDPLSQIISEFNDMFGNIQWNDADNVQKQILRIPAMVSRDEKYQNAMRNSDEQEARTESERALQKVIFAIMSDNMELFKQF